MACDCQFCNEPDEGFINRLNITEEEDTPYLRLQKLKKKLKKLNKYLEMIKKEIPVVKNEIEKTHREWKGKPIKSGIK